VPNPTGDDGQSGESNEMPAVDAVAALADPTRRALYRYVLSQSEPVSREQAATGVGIPHHVARFHLDRLQDAGLLAIDFKRPEGRSGPGAGRPTKRYRAINTELAVSVPERRYDLAGLVLTRAVAAAMEKGAPVAATLETEAGAAGRELGRQSRPAGVHVRRRRSALTAAIEALDSCGFEPRQEGTGYVLGNCPFRTLAQHEPNVVCRMNLALVSGLLDEVGVNPDAARLDPADGRCCVTISA